MPSGELTALQKRTLGYLGFKGDPDETQLSMVRDAVSLAKRLSRPQFVFRYICLKSDREGHILCDAPLDISYPSLQKLLASKGSDSLCIFVSTLGPAIDKRISDLAATDSSGMILLDSAANALIEEETNAFQSRLALPGETFRYAPGYGDVPLSMQKDIFDLMPEIGRIGITLDGSYMMHPLKYMTGLIGFKAG